MTAQVRDLAVAVWRVSELVEGLSPADLADLSVEPVLLHLQTLAAEFEDRLAAMEGQHVVR